MLPVSSHDAEPASLVVIDPNGQKARVPIQPVPFQIGRQPESNLILRDSRVSRLHAQIFVEDGEYIIEDCHSRHGTYVNGNTITRHRLKHSDRIEFGSQDSFQLLFVTEHADLARLMENVTVADKTPPAPGVGGNLAKLRAILDLARTLQSSFSIDDVLASVVDTALAITNAERGFLLLRAKDGLETRVARHRNGHNLDQSELRVPREVIHRALQHRRDLLYMNFDPFRGGEDRLQNSITDLELRSVICVPLVRIRTGQGGETSILQAGSETVGVLYMDSKVVAADMAGGNRELLQTLAIEASTVLENARLLEEEREKNRIEEELRLARSIQQSLLPGRLPSDGWLSACGSSLASHQVGGDYYDVTQVTENCWSAVVADVSGKGVSSALLASLLQGALMTATEEPVALTRRMERLNRYLIGRTGGAKYATVFYALLDHSGLMHYVNAAHCPPMIVNADGSCQELDATTVPVGLLDGSEFEICERQLAPHDKVVIYSDGVTEAQNAVGEFFGKKRLQATIAAHAQNGCEGVHDAIQEAVAAFAGAAVQSDDITVLVLEFGGSA